LDANDAWRSLTRCSYESRLWGSYDDGIVGTPVTFLVCSSGTYYGIITAFPGLDLGLDILQILEQDG
jgi:hypothetical protein